MGSNEKKGAVETMSNDEEKRPYHSPAIVYEGTINIRAGSPIPPPFTDPSKNPFLHTD